MVLYLLYYIDLKNKKPKQQIIQQEAKYYGDNLLKGSADINKKLGLYQKFTKIIRHQGPIDNQRSSNLEGVVANRQTKLE